MFPLIIPILITIIGVIYIISPIDLLPDFIPIIGWTDDIFVGVLMLVSWLIYFGVLAWESLLSSWKGILLMIFIILLIVYFAYRGKNKKGKRKRR